MPTLKLKDALGVWRDVPAIRGKTPRAKGQHIPGATYENFDWVTDGGSSYLYVYPTAASGIDLSDETHWMLIAKHGATIVGATFANDVITFTKDDGTTFNVTLAGIVAATTAANNAAALANTKAGLANQAAADVTQAIQSTEAATASALGAQNANANWTKDTANPLFYFPAPSAPLYFRREGTFTQAGSGDPSPTNIRPITPFMASGTQIKLANSGKNLLPNKFYALPSLGVIYTSPTGEISITNQPFAAVWSWLRAGTYTLSKDSGYFFSLNRISLPGAATVAMSSLLNYTFTTTVDGWVGLGIERDVSLGGVDIQFGAGALPSTFMLQIELGSVATPYEPYVGSTATP